MGCCSGDEKAQPLDSIKPYSERSCTDRIFLLAFILFWAGTVYITYHAIGQGGDPSRVVYGTNLEGQTCGISSAVKDQKYAAWPFPVEYSAQICVSDCSETATDSTRMAIRYPSKAFGSYCLPVLTTANVSLTSILALSPEFESGANTLVRAVGDVQQAAVLEGVSLGAALVLSFLYLMILRKFAGGLVWGMILTLLFLGAVGSWTLLSRASDLLNGASEANGTGPAATEGEWLRGVGYAVLAVTVLFALIVFALRDKIQMAVEVMKEASRALVHMPLIVAFPILTFLLLIAYLIFWVTVALYIYSVADRTTIPTPPTVLVDFLSGAALSNPSQMVVFDWNSNFRYTFALHFFGLLWNVQFLIYFAYLVIAGAVADWYFTPRSGPTRRDDGSAAAQSMRARARLKPAPSPAAANVEMAAQNKPHNKVAWSNDANSAAPADASVEKEEETRAYSATPIWDSFKRTIRFHIGSVAFGSLIIAIIQFIRAVVTYIESKTKSQNNRLQRAVFCVIQCLLKCVECCIDKISKNAYIWIAIQGDSFPTATCAAFTLIWRNLGRVAAINLVSSYLLFVGKLFVTLSTTVGAAFVLTRYEYYRDTVENPVIPCVVVFVLAYFVSTVFMSTFETVIDTIFFCFIVDAELNGEKGRPMMASAELQNLVGAHADASRQQAEFEQAGREPPK